MPAANSIVLPSEASAAGSNDPLPPGLAGCVLNVGISLHTFAVYVSGSLYRNNSLSTKFAICVLTLDTLRCTAADMVW